MTLDDFISSGAMTAAQLASALGCSEAQVRQWRKCFDRRKPSPAYAALIEGATGGAVMRWDSRPNDWHVIWPSLKRRKGAPPIPADKVMAA